MFNAFPLNAVPLNGLPQSGAPAEEVTDVLSVRERVK